MSTPRKNNTRVDAWIRHAEEQYEPPEDDVLGVTVIGDGLCLTIATETQTHHTTTLTTKAETIVDLGTFLKVLLATIDRDVEFGLAQIANPGPVRHLEAIAQQLNDAITRRTEQAQP